MFGAAKKPQFQRIQAPDGAEHFGREWSSGNDESAHAQRLLQAAAGVLAQGLSPSARADLQERRLVSEGAAGQEAAPPFMGPEPELQHAPAGQLLEGIQHPAFTTVERLFRVLPSDSWTSITRTPQNPLVFELGAFEVPQGEMFLVTDYEFIALRQSGVDPFDFVAAESYRFSGFMGFDITVGGRRTGNLFYQLDPAPQQFQRQSFDTPIGAGPGFTGPGFAGAAQQRQFNVQAANSFGSVAGQGTSLLPVRPNVQGPRDQPFTMIARAGDAVSLSCTIFRRVTAPLAGIQGSVSGYKLHQNTMSALLNRVRPR